MVATRSAKGKPAAFTSRKHSPEARANIAAANRRPEKCAKSAAAHTGRKHSPETRAKIAAAMTGHVVSPETRAKISAAHKGRKPVEVEYPDPGGSSPAAANGEGNAP
jgi:hypothetical protein